MAATFIADPLTHLEDRIAHWRRVLNGSGTEGLAREQMESFIDDLVTAHGYVADNIEAMADRELESRLRIHLPKPECGSKECMKRYRNVRTIVRRSRT